MRLPDATRVELRNMRDWNEFRLPGMMAGERAAFVPPALELDFSDGKNV
jgi:hypothetical protein